MSANESLGSHQINSFAALLEENLQTYSESSRIQIPQLKKMVDGKKPQKGGKRKEEQTAFEILMMVTQAIASSMKQFMGRKPRSSAKRACKRSRGTGCMSRETTGTSLLSP
jgi:hypothetical protein